MKKVIKVEDKYIGEGYPVFIVAEVGQNHNGDINIAKKLIDIAAEPIIDHFGGEKLRGVDAVKFAKRNISSDLTMELYNKPYNGPNSFGKTYGKHREYLELSEEDHFLLAEYAKNKGLIYFSSVCDQVSVDLMQKIGVPLYKVASRDVTNIPLLEYIAQKGKPIIMSTGMSDMDEIEMAVNTIKKYNDQLILLQCTSEYPAQYRNVHLRVMQFLREKFDVPVGFSGHTIGVAIAIAAVAMGAVVIEKHITIDRKMKGSDHAGALGPDGLWRVVRNIRNTELALGKRDKQLLEAELPGRRKLGRSLVSKIPIPEGTVVTEDMLVVKSPGSEIKWADRHLIINKKAKHDIDKDVTLKLEDFK